METVRSAAGIDWRNGSFCAYAHAAPYAGVTVGTRNTTAVFAAVGV